MIANYAGAALIVAAFWWLLQHFDLVNRARLIGVAARQSAATLANAALTDDEKGRAMRRDSIALFGHFARLSLLLAIALGLPMLVVWVLGLARLWRFEDVIAASLSWPFLLAGVVLFIALVAAERRRGAG
ncbi:MAG: hypothetical protein ABIT04_08330 [Novosphingobium sp.]